MDTTDQTKREQYILGLRQLADALEQHPELHLPYNGTSDSAHINIIPLDEGREQAAAWAAVLPGRKDKEHRGDYLDLTGAFAGLHIKVICDRTEVCERVVTGTREVTEEVPDPEALAAVPKVTVTRTVEDVEWRCAPLLAADEAAKAGAR